MIIFLVIAVIILVVLEANKKINSKQFINDLNPYFKFLMEDDYVFLAGVKYGNDIDIEKLFNIRIRNGVITIAAVLILSLSRLNFVFVLAAVVLGFVVFKMPYFQLTSYYKKNLYTINLMLPYYLKSLEILIQHYTVPVAMARSIDTAPEIFKPGLQRLVEKIEAGNSTVDPYMDFAKEYPVRDSMRMMRLLYRLSLGSQENKQAQLEQFSKTVSTLQNKSREQKYKDRLDTMEKKTMIMLVATGGGVLLLLFMSLTMMINF
ncbi:MAG: hypothetical protein IJ134_03915 [Bacilli bacterium]|nr:hypothetical protein [Bacilli bacterium]